MIHPSPADRRHWIAILHSLRGNQPLPVGQDLSQALHAARGRNRMFIVTCLRAVHSVRQGQPVAAAIDLPSMPLPLPASQGNHAAEVVWLAYLRYLQNDDAARHWLREACAALDPTALRTTASDNPEPWWQNEMLILHALHSFALLSQDATAMAKTLACADFHIREIQPDHATNEPWACHAYATHPDGRITAETLLHSAQIQNGGQLTEISRLVVADAVASLEAAADA